MLVFSRFSKAQKRGTPTIISFYTLITGKGKENVNTHNISKTLRIKRVVIISV